MSTYEGLDLSTVEGCASAIEMDLRDAIRGLVDDTTEVIISTNIHKGRIMFDITAGTQTGFLIGKGGRNAEALRTLLKGYASKYRRHNQQTDDLLFREVVLHIDDGKHNNEEKK